MKLAARCALFVLAAPCLHAQSTYYAIAFQENRLLKVETEAGAVLSVSEPLTDLAGPSREVEPVGDEIWVAGRRGLYRYDAATLDLLGDAYHNYEITAIVPRSSGGAILFAIERTVPYAAALEVDASGGLVLERPAPLFLGDAVAIGSDYAATTNGEVFRIDGSTLFPEDVFVTGATTTGSFPASLYDPRWLTALPNGSIGISSPESVVVADSSGVTQLGLNIAPSDRAVFASGPDELCILARDRVVLVDTAKLEPSVGFALGYLNYFAGGLTASSHASNAPGASSRTCPSSPNSTGDAARASILAFEEADQRTLSLFGSRMPPGMLALPLFGVISTPTPFGSGQLCIDVDGGNMFRAPLRTVDGAGRTKTEFDFQTAGRGLQFATGTSWVFQVAFRDPAGAGLGVTDAVTLMFR